MSNVIAFPIRPAPVDPDLDLETAVDVAIRDLRDLAERLRADAAGHEQAKECLDMLQRALDNAQRYG